MRELSKKDVQSAMYRGLLLSAGGSGVNFPEKYDPATEFASGLNIARVAYLPTEDWSDPVSLSDGCLDKHGNPNVLTQDKGSSPPTQAPGCDSLLVEI